MTPIHTYTNYLSNLSTALFLSHLVSLFLTHFLSSTRTLKCTTFLSRERCCVVISPPSLLTSLGLFCSYLFLYLLFSGLCYGLFVTYFTLPALLATFALCVLSNYTLYTVTSVLYPVCLLCVAKSRS